ncbi:beta-galactosidase [Promicromonospora sp. NPDC060271]|uniref:beta-galactosidase n=1 Tax=Promicromonospora sp. NPDC060271 TaxID=3347089 RepID=UPI0036645928
MHLAAAAGVSRIRFEAWTAPLAPSEAITATDGRLVPGPTHLSRDGRPVIPVSGELHFSRVPRSDWDARLRLMRAGGVTAVSTYVIWIHHEADRGEVSFDGGLDVAAFIDTAQAAGLDVVLRIGPWAHGEVRNGGLPDWVQALDVRQRTDDPGYLDVVREWFGALGAHLAGRVRPGGPVVAVQIENELYDQPEHIRTLIGLARKAGIEAPIWTATAWGGAELPDEVLPLYGGYGDGFWVPSDHPWDPSFRAHYFFGHVWDDPGIGSDQRADASTPTTAAEHRGPAATCELGGGMAASYHRRPVLQPADVAAIAHTKIGNGSVWQGYYMYAGGSNVWRGPDLQESLATGYPNDLPVFDYDFHAPIGAAGSRAASFDLLRDQHAFLAAFGDRLATMSASMPETRPAGLDDTTTLRWALRSDGTSGFVVIGQHQPYAGLRDAEPTRFAVELTDRVVELPTSPVSVPAGTMARWPVGLRLAGTPEIEWATASAVTILDGDGPSTLVLRAERGIDPVLAFADPEVDVVARTGAVALLDGAWAVTVDDSALLEVRAAGTALDVLVLGPARAARTWVLDHGGRRTLLVADDDLWTAADGSLAARTTGATVGAIERWEPTSGRFVRLAGPDAEPRSGACAVVAERPPGEVPTSYGGTSARGAAPSHDLVRRAGAVWTVELPAWTAEPGADAVVDVEWAGDVALLEVGGRVVADRFWDGTPWRLDLGTLGPLPAEVRLVVLPLHPDNPVWLPAAAEARRRDTAGRLVALDSITVTERITWTAALDGGRAAYQDHVAPVE